MIEQETASPSKRTNVHSHRQSGSSRDGGSVTSRRDEFLARFRQLSLWRPLLLPLFHRLWAGEAASLLADQVFFVTLTFLVTLAARVITARFALKR